MQFELTMMCGACKWKIENALKENGFNNFYIDMNTNILTFEEEISPEKVIKVVNNIGYQIKYRKPNPLFDEDN